MSCVGRNMRAQARPVFPCYLRQNCAFREYFCYAQPNSELSAIQSCISWLAAAALLRSRRHCVMDAAPTSMPPDPPVILARALSWKIRVTRVQHYSRGTRTRAWFDLGEPGQRRELEPSAFAFCVRQQIVDRAQDRDRGREGRNPHDTRSVAVVGSRQHPAHERIGEDRDRDGRGEPSRLVEAARNCCSREQHEREDHRAERDRYMDPIDRIEVKLTALLPGVVHGRHFAWNVALDDAVGVPDLIVRAVTGRDQPQLRYRSRKGGFDLLQRILLQTVQDDEAHLLIEAAEATEFVEDAVAPQKIIGGCRQLVAVRTELEPRGWTMIVEIALDDAILQHAAEGNSEAARRPSELSRQGEIAHEQHGCSRGNGAAAGEKRARATKA